MKKKILILGLGFCLLATACSGKNTSKQDAPNRNTEENVEDESGEEPKISKEENENNHTQANEDEKNDAVQELSKVPEITFVDYSQNIQDEDSNVLMLSVTENCPVITIEENQDAAERMNLVFEQQHVVNQEEIEERVKTAGDYYKELSEEEAASWGGYGYGMSYKAVCVSTRILSIVAENYEWEGAAHPNTWTSSYCFDVTSGDLLSLSDVFSDEDEARKVVSEHILDTITKEPYKDGLLEDYESYVNDIMTETTFYLNETGLVVICNPYMVTAYAAGTIEVEIPYADIKDYMNQKYVLN